MIFVGLILSTTKRKGTTETISTPNWRIRANKKHLFVYDRKKNWPNWGLWPRSQQMLECDICRLIIVYEIKRQLNNICPIEQFKPTSDFELPKQNCLTFEPTWSTCPTTTGKKLIQLRFAAYAATNVEMWYLSYCLWNKTIEQNVPKWRFEPPSDFELPKWNCLTFMIQKAPP